MEKEILNQQELLNKLNQIDNVRDKALCSFLYLTGARVSEVVFRFKVKEIRVQRDKDRIFYIFNVYTEKRREHKDVYRSLGIPYEKYYKELIDTIIGYISRYRLKENDYLFEINRRTAYNITKKWLNVNPHFLRHTRATHLATLNNFTALELKEWFGWAKVETASIYTHLNWQNVSHKL